MALPSEHLIDGITHPSSVVSQAAFEVESGSRPIDTLSPKMLEGVHLHLSETRAKERYLEEIRRSRGKH